MSFNYWQDQIDVRIASINNEIDIKADELIDKINKYIRNDACLLQKNPTSIKRKIDQLFDQVRIDRLSRNACFEIINLKKMNLKKEKVGLLCPQLNHEDYYLHYVNYTSNYRHVINIQNLAKGISFCKN